MEEALKKLPDKLRANGGLKYWLTLQRFEGSWRCGYYCLLDNRWLVYSEAELPGLAVEDLAFNKLYLSIK